MSDACIEGGCLCGAVRFRLTLPAQWMIHCHCSRCRRSSGAAHATNLTAPPENFAWLSGEEAIARYALPGAASFGKWFCRHCGCPLPRLARGGTLVVVPAGSLDEGLPMVASAHIFWGSRAPWSCPAGGLPTHDAYPSAWR